MKIGSVDSMRRPIILVHTSRIPLDSECERSVTLPVHVVAAVISAYWLLHSSVTDPSHFRRTVVLVEGVILSSVVCLPTPLFFGLKDRRWFISIDIRTRTLRY